MGKPTFVPRQNKLTVMVLGLADIFTLAVMRFWVRRGAQTADRQTVVLAWLKKVVLHLVVHLEERGESCLWPRLRRQPIVRAILYRTDPLHRALAQQLPLIR
jgi:hypothetical protein